MISRKIWVAFFRDQVDFNKRCCRIRDLNVQISNINIKMARFIKTKSLGLQPLQRPTMKIVKNYVKSCRILQNSIFGSKNPIFKPKCSGLRPLRRPKVIMKHDLKF